MKPHLKLIKGFAVSQPQEPDNLEAAIERFLMYRSALEKGTLKQYGRVLKLYQTISPAWPPTPESLAVFIAHCRDSYGDYTTHTYFSIVRGFIRFLLKKRLIADDPLDEISPPRAPVNLPRAPAAEHLKRLTGYLESEVENVLKGCDKRKGWREVRNLALFSLLLDSGLRVAEAANVRLEDVDFDNWLVFVRKGKGTKQREAPLGRTTRADLKLWLAYRETLKIPAGSPGSTHLFVSKRRTWTPMGVGHIEQILEALCSRLEIEPKITPHLLRHAFAVYSHENGASLERIRQWLGHSSLGTTARYLMTREGLREHLKSSPRDHQF
jgi:site-specific recombinase XerD